MKISNMVEPDDLYLAALYVHYKERTDPTWQPNAVGVREWITNAARHGLDVALEEAQAELAKAGVKSQKDLDRVARERMGA
jgi:hypothetical protein